ncbi:MAG: oligoendopeptidase F [Clostridiales bacterium]|nr:oligoendopeptidase F [Clostridiales bacterium]
MKKRSQIDEKYKWNLLDIYKNDDELLEDIERLKSYPEIILKFKGKLKKVTKCLEFFTLSTEISKLAEKISSYVYLRLSENMENTKFIELESVLSDISKKISVASSFEEEELLSYGDKYIHKLLADERFALYKIELQDFLRNKDHILPEAQEIIVNKSRSAIGGYSDVFDNLDNLDIKFESVKDSKGKTHEVNQHNYVELLESKDRVLRKNAYLSFTKGYNNFNNTISSNYISSVEGDWFLADVYNFKSTLEMSLHDDNLPNDIYTRLIENIRKNVKYVHKFYNLKKKALKISDYSVYDKFISVVDFKKKYTFEECFDIVKNALSVFGDEYITCLTKAKDERWIDVYPCEKKEGGGYCLSMYKPHPYILLNTVDDSSSIYTLAHELGHAMHGYLSAKNQPFETYDHTIFLAEIASTVNEVLLFKYLFQNSTNKKEKLFHVEKYIQNIISTIYVQSLFSEFEYFAHTLVENGKPISKEILNKKYSDLIHDYYGSSLKNTKEDIGAGWSRIPHFYRSYYVYKYATGMTSAINFARGIFSGDEDVKNKYLNFLKSGSKDYSYDTLKTAGVDLLTNEPYDILFKELSWALKEMENLI